MNSSFTSWIREGQAAIAKQSFTPAQKESISLAPSQSLAPSGLSGAFKSNSDKADKSFVISTPRTDSIERLIVDSAKSDTGIIKVEKAMEVYSAINITLRDRVGAIVPPYNPYLLLALVDSSGYLAGGNFWKATSTVGQGYDGDPELLAHLDMANERDTFQDILDQWAADVDIYGNAYIESIRTGVTANFYNMSATRTRVKPDEKSNFYHFIHYEYALGTLIVKQYDEYVPGQMSGVRQFKLPSRRGHPFYGDPEYISAKRPLTLNYDILSLAEKFFENSFMGDKSIVIKGADYTDEDILRFRNYLTSTAKGLENAHKIIVFQVAPTEDVVISDLNVEIKDASFSGLRSDNKEEIIIANRVPGAIMGVQTAGKLGDVNQIREGLRLFKVGFANARQRKYEKWWRNLLRDLGLPKSETFKLNPMDTLSENTDLPGLAQAVSAGLMTTEQAQEQLAMEKRDAGAKRVTPADLIKGLMEVRDQLIAEGEANG